MRIVVGAMFRDAADYIHQYFDQVDALEELLFEQGHTVRYVFAENDSSDDTAALLAAFRDSHVDGAVTVIDRSEGLPYWGSVDHEPRWRHIAYVCNGILEQIRLDDDLFLYVECDLQWEPEDLVKLVDAASEGLCVGGMVFKRDIYYDTWGTVRRGIHFQHRYPWHPDFVGWEGGLMGVDSAAGATALPAQVAAVTRFGECDAYVGWCRSIRERGKTFWLDTTVRLRHP